MPATTEPDDKIPKIVRTAVVDVDAVTEFMLLATEGCPTVFPVTVRDEAAPVFQIPLNPWLIDVVLPRIFRAPIVLLVILTIPVELFEIPDDSPEVPEAVNVIAPVPVTAPITLPLMLTLPPDTWIPPHCPGRVVEVLGEVQLKFVIVLFWIVEAAVVPAEIEIARKV